LLLFLFVNFVAVVIFSVAVVVVPPAKVFNKEVFPDPEGPMIANNDPAGAHPDTSTSLIYS